jgi:hypothetical protein
MNPKEQDPIAEVAKLDPLPPGKDDDWAETADGDRVLGVILSRIECELSTEDELVKKGGDTQTAPVAGAD